MSMATSPLRDRKLGTVPIKVEPRDRAFTLIELVIVIIIAGALFALVGFQTGIFAYWREEGFVRRLSETIEFLHAQAVADQAFYRLEFNLQKHQFVVGVLRPDESANDEILQEIAANVGTLTLELTAFLNPSVGEGQSFIPPPTFPSLAEPVPFPSGVVMEDMRTMRGKTRPDQEVEYIDFSPRGFSEFSVLHLKLSSGQPITILVNPFTGSTEIYREYKDFEWTYSGKEGDK